MFLAVKFYSKKKLNSLLICGIIDAEDKAKINLTVMLSPWV